jgi:hypothetical protein
VTGWFSSLNNSRRVLLWRDEIIERGIVLSGTVCVYLHEERIPKGMQTKTRPASSSKNVENARRHPWRGQ